MVEQVSPELPKKEEVRLTPEILDQLHRLLHPMFRDKKLGSPPELEEPNLRRALGEADKLDFKRGLIHRCLTWELAEELGEKLDERLVRVLVRGGISMELDEWSLPMGILKEENPNQMTFFWWWLKGIHQAPHCPDTLRKQLEKLQAVYEGKKPEEIELVFAAIVDSYCVEDSPSRISWRHQESLKLRPEIRAIVSRWGGFSSRSQERRERLKTFKCEIIFRELTLLWGDLNPEFLGNLNRLVLINNSKEAREEAIRQTFHPAKTVKIGWDTLLGLRRFIRRFR